MVRLPSLVHVIRSAQQSARRFPGTLLSAFIGAGICWLLIRQSQSYKAYEALLDRLLLPAMLGFEFSSQWHCGLNTLGGRTDGTVWALPLG